MRRVPARVLFSLLVVCAAVLGVVTRRTIFFIVAALPLVLLATSLPTSALPLSRALNRFTNQAVDVRLWGAQPPNTSGSALTLTSVNVLGVGVHLFFKASDGNSMHLKIAQPRKTTIARDHITIEAVRYVQWNRTKLKPGDTSVAVSIALSGSSTGRSSS